MHHPDTHTHAHIQTHQKQWAVKRCPYPPQKASTNQIRPDQNMPFKVRAGVREGAFRGAQPMRWPWEQLAWPEKKGEGLGGSGIIKEGTQKYNHYQSRNTSWTPLRAYSAPGPCLTNRLLHTRHLHPRYCNSPTASYSSPAPTLGPGLPLRKPGPYPRVYFKLVLIIACMSYLILWVRGLQKVSDVKYTTCVGSFTFSSLLIEDQFYKDFYTCTQA